MSPRDWPLLAVNGTVLYDDAPYTIQEVQVNAGCLTSPDVHISYAGTADIASDAQDLWVDAADARLTVSSWH